MVVYLLFWEIIKTVTYNDQTLHPIMPLVFVGLGLWDEKDITVRGLETVKAAERVYLESYTSKLFVDVKILEEYYDKAITVYFRKDIEERCQEMLEEAKTKLVAFLVVGDPFCATTHSDLYLRAVEEGIDVSVISNASVMNAVASCGLQLYRFGATISVPYFTDMWRPDSFYDKLKANRSMMLHTLCLLDIKVREQTIENMMRGRDVFEAPQFMTICEAVSQLLEVEEKRKEGVCDENVKAFAVCRLGSPSSESIFSGTLKDLSKFQNFGEPLHSLIVCAPDLHEIEEKFYDLRHIQ